MDTDFSWMASLVKMQKQETIWSAAALSYLLMELIKIQVAWLQH